MFPPFLIILCNLFSCLNNSSEVQYEGKTIELGLWDTAGQEDYDRIRPLSYPGANVILLCFSLADMVTMENIKTKWMPEMLHHLPNTPKILVGTKKDMRENSKTKVSTHEGEEFCKALKLSGYCECSAKTQEGLKEVFDNAIRIYLETKKPTTASKKSGCLLI